MRSHQTNSEAATRARVFLIRSYKLSARVQQDRQKAHVRMKPYHQSPSRRAITELHRDHQDRCRGSIWLGLKRLGTSSKPTRQLVLPDDLWLIDRHMSQDHAALRGQDRGRRARYPITRETLGNRRNTNRIHSTASPTYRGGGLHRRRLLRRNSTRHKM